MSVSRLVSVGFAIVAIWAVTFVIGCGSSSSNSCDAGCPVTGAGGSGTGSGGSAGAAAGAGGSASGGQGGAGNDLGTITHCDINSAGTQTCLEYGTDYTASRAAGCAVLSGSYSAGPCDHASSSGGCKRVFGSGGTETDYYYPPITVADVQVQCVNDANATYVAP